MSIYLPAAPPAHGPVEAATRWSHASERELAHVHALRARGARVPPGPPPSADILDSWVRCTADGLDSGGRLRVPVVESADLARRRDRAEVTRRLARAELETLAQQIAGSDFLLAFADPDGVILDLYADNGFAMNSADAGIVAGSLWSEAQAGTNGLGTALALDRAVAVTGLEHYLLQLGNFSCTAAPVHDARGEVVGVLDASSFFESRQQHTQALVQMAATHVERGLLMHQMRGHLTLAIHPRPEYLQTLGAGLIVFDDGGRLVALDARARRLLHGVVSIAGQSSFETIFGEPFDALLARIDRSAELRLRDALGRVLVASCVGRPAPRRSHAPLAGSLAGSLAGPPREAAAPIGTDSAERTGRRAMLARAGATGAPARVVADDPAVAEACRTVEAAVRIGVPILICGETGSGKEVLARHAHRASGRTGAFVAVNCAALPAELVEAELFGYAGGAFTGARRGGSPGLIASAHGGTLLLDELCELPLPQQAALLRFLDDWVVRPVGGVAEHRVDVQLLAATNVDLDAEVAAHRFRADLLYRLNTVRVVLPPLRERTDFALAVRSVLLSIDRDSEISDAAVARLARHGWPGNFRELRSHLTRALLLLRADHRIDTADVERTLPPAPAAPASALARRTADIVRSEFDRHGGSVSRTARALGISRTTVYRHLRGAA